MFPTFGLDMEDVLRGMLSVPIARFCFHHDQIMELFVRSDKE